MSRTVEQIQFAPRMPKPLRVAAYARVSSGKDAMLHSLAAQISFYSDLIQNHDDWLYVGVYADEWQRPKHDMHGLPPERVCVHCRQSSTESVGLEHQVYT